MKTQEFVFPFHATALFVLIATILSLSGFAVPPATLSGEDVEPVPATAGVNPGINYSTGFEPEEGFSLGYISNSGGTPAGCGGVAFPCWGHTTSTTCNPPSPGPVCTFSLITPSIENVHPSTGLQHLRLTHDPTTRTNTAYFGLGVDARYPRTADLSVRPVAPNTVSADIAISASGGMNYRIQPQSNSQGLPATSVLFYHTGAMYVLDDLCGTTALAFQPTGVMWDTSGDFQNLTIAMDPCAPSTCGGAAGYGPSEGDYVGVVNYYYGGNLIWSGLPYAGTNLEAISKLILL